MIITPYLIAFEHFMLIQEDGINMINQKVFKYIKGGVRIYYPDGVIRFVSNSWEGEMFI